MQEWTFTVFGIPQPKGSARAFLPKGARYPIVTSDNPKNKGWQQLVAEAASRTLSGHGQLTTGAVAIAVAFYLPRPKSLGKRERSHLTRPDLDKLVRSVKDALSKVIWLDDGQVVSLTAQKAYANLTESPRAVIHVRTVEI